MIIICVLCFAVLGAGLFLMFSDTMISVPGKKPSSAANAPVTFDGPIKTIAINGGGKHLLSAEPTKEEYQKQLDEMLDFAAVTGYDAVIWQGVGADGFYCRIKDAQPAEFIKALDKLFDKWDPLEYLCSAASQRGLGVFMAFEPQFAVEETIAAIEKKYTVSGTYVVNVQDAGQSLLNATFTGINGEPELLEPSLSAQYPELLAKSKQDNFGGLMFGYYPNVQQNTDTLSLWASMFNEANDITPLNFTISNQLELTYPQNTSASIYTTTCYLMGTSDPQLPLTLNGTEVARFGTNGAFGVLVDLNVGANNFELAQNEIKVAFTLTRKKYTSTGAQTIKQDDTVEATKGQMFEIVSGIASGLTDPASDSAINETFKKGAKATVVDSVRTTRSGKKTWAYKLSTGDYVLARNVKLLDSAETPAFNTATVEKGQYGETITFDGNGTPLVYTQKEGNALVLTFTDLTLPDTFSIENSDYIDSAVVTKQEGKTALVLQLKEKMLWGWDILYKDGKTSLFLKYPPIKSTTFGKPLEGVRIMLDPGHGDQDYGALGVAGEKAPSEKNVNLAVAEAAKQTLEQMGATVILTRSDDTFRTLDERLEAQSIEMTDFFVSVHHNSVELVVNANESTGTECYYFYKTSEELAKNLSAQVSTASNRLNREQKYGYFYVTRTTIAPSVLLETGFMVNPLEYEAITNNDVIAKTGAALAKGILDTMPNS